MGKLKGTLGKLKGTMGNRLCDAVLLLEDAQMRAGSPVMCPVEESALCDVQTGKQSSAGGKRGSSSGNGGDMGWPKAAWYLKGTGR